MPMPTVLALIVALLWVQGAPALAQNAKPERATPPAAAANSPMPWPAPVGHRQPRAKDVATPKPDPYEREFQRLQRALDGQLRICGGC
jgi:hypothetical protein